MLLTLLWHSEVRKAGGRVDRSENVSLDSSSVRWPLTSNTSEWQILVVESNKALLLKWNFDVLFSFLGYFYYLNFYSTSFQRQELHFSFHCIYLTAGYIQDVHKTKHKLIEYNVSLSVYLGPLATFQMSMSCEQLHQRDICPLKIPWWFHLIKMHQYYQSNNIIWTNKQFTGVVYW